MTTLAGCSTSSRISRTSTTNPSRSVRIAEIGLNNFTDESFTAEVQILDNGTVIFNKTISIEAAESLPSGSIDACAGFIEDYPTKPGKYVFRARLTAASSNSWSEVNLTTENSPVSVMVEVGNPPPPFEDPPELLVWSYSTDSDDTLETCGDVATTPST